MENSGDNMLPKGIVVVKEVTKLDSSNVVDKHVRGSVPIRSLPRQPLAAPAGSGLSQKQGYAAVCDDAYPHAVSDTKVVMTITAK